MRRMDAPHTMGYVHVYTGDGKGKTTAALGLAIRAAGAGWNVFFAQFAKGMSTSELSALARFDDRIAVRRFGCEGFIRGRPSADDLAAARQGIEECHAALVSSRYELVILDEANLGPALDLFPAERLVELIDARPEHVELVITGRQAAAQVLARADLVTEMREVKHYYRRGVLARTGIEK
ncbi:MAG: cob(I)yrinic acid a,c-diamide adenosyltransferase [Planctomycetota bacterium]